MPVISTLQSQTGGLMQILGQPDLYGEFQANQDYTRRPCAKTQIFITQFAVTYIMNSYFYPSHL